MPSNYDAYMSGQDDPGADPKKQEDAVRKKLNRIRDAKELRKKNDWDERWSKFIKVYSNQYPYTELSDYDDIVAPNMVFSTVNVIVPSIAVHSPKITVAAKNEELHQTAEVVEAVVNHQWRQFHVQDEVALAIKDFVIVGHGWLKVVWDTERKEVDIDPMEWQELASQVLMEREQAVQNSPLSEDEFPSVEEVLESLPTTKEIVVRDAPKVKRVSPFDVFVDPDANSMDEARWIAHRYLVPVKVAKAKEEWDAKARRELKATRMSDARDEADIFENTQSRSDESGFVVVYEMYDLIDETLCVVAENGKRYLVPPTDSPFPGGHPFVFVPNYTVPERFYPIGDVETVWGLQLELASTRTAMINDRKRGRRVNFVRSTALSPEAMSELRSGRDNVLLDVLEDRPFGEVFAQLSSQGLQPEWYQQSQMIQQDIDIVTGISEYARGAMPELRRTATEAALIQDNANARSADKLYKVEQAMARVAERMIQLSQEFMEIEDVARVVSEDMTVAWVPYDRESLKGDFVFEVEAGSTQPQNETFRRQSAMQLMDAMSPLAAAGIVNPFKLAEHVLRYGFGIRNAEEYLMDPNMMGGEEPPPEEGGPPPEGGMPPQGMMM